MQEIYNKINELPSDLFSLKSTYLYRVYSLAESDIDSAVVLLGKAGERLAKGALKYFSIEYDEHASFDALLRQLSSASPPPALVVGLRTVLKYRNQAAHDTDTDLTVYDLEAAVSSFCAAYQTAYNLVEGSAAAAADGTSSIERVNSGTQGSGIQGPGIQGVHRIYGRSASFLDRFMAHIRALCFVTAAILLLAVIRGGSYDFFLALRVIVTVNAGLFVYVYKKSVPFLLLFGGIAILFNPLFPFYFSREVWKILDLAVMGVFAVTAFKSGRRDKIIKRTDYNRRDYYPRE